MKPAEKDFRARIYESYYTLQVRQGNTYQASLEAFRDVFWVHEHHFGRFLPYDPEAPILDIGCGDGSFVYWLQQKGYRHTEGVDLSAQMVEQGRALGVPNLQVGDLFQFLAESDRQYQLIIARDVLEHLQKQEVFDLLDLVYDRLQPGGHFLIQVPNGQGLFASRILYGDYTHVTAFTTKSLRQIMEACGFQQVRSYSMSPVPRGLKRRIRRLLWDGIVAVVRFAQKIETGHTEGYFTQNLIAVARKPEHPG